MSLSAYPSSRHLEIGSPIEMLLKRPPSTKMFSSMRCGGKKKGIEVDESTAFTLSSKGVVSSKKTGYPDKISAAIIESFLFQGLSPTYYSILSLNSLLSAKLSSVNAFISIGDRNSNRPLEECPA